MIALFLHSAILMILYKKFYAWDFRWAPGYTYFMFASHQFMLIFLIFEDLVSDEDLVNYYNWRWTWFFIFILFYILTLINIFFFVYSFAMRKELTAHAAEEIIQLFNAYIAKNWANILKKTYKNFLIKEWYKYQLNYTKTFKTRFAIFIKLTGILLIFLKLFFYIYIIYLSIATIHISYVYIVEVLIFKKRMLFYIFLLKTIFFINLYLSFFFDRINFFCIFFFYSFEPLETFVNIYGIESITYWFTRVYNQDQMIFSLSGVYRAITEAGCKDEIESKNDWDILFTKKTFIYRNPLVWYSTKNKTVDCMVNHHYFKLWMGVKRYVFYLVQFPEYIDNMKDRGTPNFVHFRDVNETAQSCTSRTYFEKDLKKFKIK